MSTLGKILAVLNVLAAAAFFCLVALDWGMHRAWSRAVFQHDLVIQGLPVDDKQTDVDGQNVAGLITPGMLQQLVPGADTTIKTQEAEVSRRKDQLRAEVNATPN